MDGYMEIGDRREGEEERKKWIDRQIDLYFYIYIIVSDEHIFNK